MRFCDSSCVSPDAKRNQFARSNGIRCLAHCRRNQLRKMWAHYFNELFLLEVGYALFPALARQVLDSTGRLLAGAHRGMTVKGLFWEISSALAAQRTGPDNMRCRHHADGNGFPAPFTSQNGLRPGFQVDHGRQFRRIKNECPVSASLPDFDKLPGFLPAGKGACQFLPVIPVGYRGCDRTCRTTSRIASAIASGLC